MPRQRPLLAFTLLASTALAQANAVPGTDVNLYNVGNPTIYGRRGPAFPNGEVGVGFGHGFCNGGTVHVPWVTWYAPNTMTTEHFRIAFMVVRESNGRMEQVSTRDSYVKHSRVTYNLGSSQCGTCSSGSGNLFYMGCFDAYSTSYNGDRYNLGPTSEIDPWLGTWDPVGSYFDRGDPAVSGASAMDGRQSLTHSQTNLFDPVKNRVTIPESELSQPGTYYGQVHLVCQGEPLMNRGNNQRSAQLNFNHSGSSWSVSNAGSQMAGSVLEQWSGASVALGGNGMDDGRFAVGVKVTGPVGGMYHYEYAVHNIDNNRGGASFRIPLNGNINVTNPGFGDIDTNALNEWTFTQSATELSWTASAHNPLDWNTIYNFHFDSDTPPGVGGILIDQARIGPGALNVAVTTDVPGGVQPATVTPVGTACGDCETTFYEFFATAATMDLSNTAATLSFQNGSYTAVTGTRSFQAPTGNPLPLGDDTEVSVTLPFTLPYPGGTTNNLLVCSNGFVSPAASSTTLWIPIVQVFLNLQPRWAAAWHDFAPQSAGAGNGVFFNANPSGATVTFQNVPNSGFGNPGTSTFQLQFEPNGTVHMVWQNMSTNGNGYLVGWTPGGGAADPGNSDLTTALATGIPMCATAPQQISLTADARPILGTTIQQTTSNIAPGTPFGVHVMALTAANPPIDLTSIGMEGCFSYTGGGVAGGVNELYFPGSASSVSVPLAIPNDTGLMGITIAAQSYAYVPPLTSSGMIASNGIVMFLGPL